MTATVLAGDAAQEAGVPPIVWGLGVLAVLMLLLIITLAFGKGRPHA